MFYRKGSRRAFENENWDEFIKIFQQVKKHSLAGVYESECKMFRYDWRSRNHSEHWSWSWKGRQTLAERRQSIRRSLYALSLIKALINDEDYKAIPQKYKRKGPGCCSLLVETEAEVLERECADHELEVKKKGRWG